MEHTFVITIKNSSDSLDYKRFIELDDGGVGEVTFTVTNATNQPLRGRAKIIALNSVKQEWLTIAGEAECNFSAKGAQDFTIRVAVPPDTPAGKYSFRLDVVAEPDSDENFGEGPVVAFDVKPAAKTEKKSRWWIVAVAAAVIVVIVGVVVWLLLPKKVEVPDVVGRSLAEATARIEGAGLLVSLSEPIVTGKLAPGYVSSQNPPKESLLSKGESVTLILEALPMPDVVGRDPADAKRRLEEKGLKAEDAGLVATGKVALGQIASQDPKASELVSPGITVKLFVEGAKVPKIVGSDVALAQLAILKSQLKLKDNRQKTANNQEWGKVLSQDPQPGEIKPVNSVVTVTAGAIEVPDVTGKLWMQAEAIMVAHSLTVEIKGKKKGILGVPNTVETQSILPGTLVYPGAKITLILRDFF